jgi:diaminohydroxyphosphoribosylaminopyrimidine deaminase/5-amino-6-(5-phosphoribosylamino)uracil reductase
MTEPNRRVSEDERLLRMAVDLSLRCVPSKGAFSVGALILQDGKIVATGYSREEQGHEHAEETAIRRALEAGIKLSGAAIYSSMEPCSARLSGRRCCCDRILEAGLHRVVFASREPPTFVNGRGTETLRAAGIEVCELPSLAPLVERVNQHLDWNERGAKATPG